jgi:hypothetical protein
MKTMTYKKLGGTCGQKLSADTCDGMVQAMTKHVMEKHPDVAKDIPAYPRPSAEISSRYGIGCVRTAA